MLVYLAYCSRQATPPEHFKVDIAENVRVIKPIENIRRTTEICVATAGSSRERGTVGFSTYANYDHVR